MESGARYDGLAEWYDEYIHGERSEYIDEICRLVRQLLGEGTGRLLDQGCGGGAFFDLLAELGWSVVGLDDSADQLRIAASRAEAVGAELVQGDATDLPFDDASFDAVVAILVSTDIEPWETLVAETARVLRPEGRFVFLAMHPCFVGPHAVFREEDRRVGPGYRDRTRQFDLPAFQPTGLRARVGAVHVPLAEMLNALLDRGLAIRRGGRNAGASIDSGGRG